MQYSATGKKRIATRLVDRKVASSVGEEEVGDEGGGSAVGGTEEGVRGDPLPNKHVRIAVVSPRAELVPIGYGSGRVNLLYVIWVKPIVPIFVLLYSAHPQALGRFAGVHWGRERNGAEVDEGAARGSTQALVKKYLT
ncbi:hypothetical protein BHM03_00002954 [Ensete ventricosum]|uniref:Uncharacterized protein n=1 Tax=Ensete ventricosum TaxID=4639 RepID=A0A445M9W8_ENSVE|nr:hypothetical protein BHM03_00002954 [Ensete ventricosum]